MKVLILAYHRVYPGYHIDPETFEYQIRTLKERFVSLTLNEVVAFAKGDFNLKKNGFAITFDDGWADNFVYAYPILKKHNVPATIFIPTNFISSKRIKKFDYLEAKSMAKAINTSSEEECSSEFLTWEEISNMKPLIQIESHGHSHLHLPKNPPEKIKNDLGDSIKIITEKTGRRPKHLAWPFGEYSETALEMAKEVGFEACLTTRIGAVKRGDNLYELKRFSPPRNRHLFLTALKGNAGMALYRLGITLKACKANPSINLP